MNGVNFFGMEQWQFICFIFIPVFVVVCIIYMVRRRRLANRFREEHGDVCYLIPRLINGNGEIQIHSVDGEKPVFTNYHNRNAILTAPGTHKIISSVVLDKEQGALFLQGHGLSASSYKNEKTEQELTAEQGQNYFYIFDAETFTYSLDEIKE